MLAHRYLKQEGMIWSEIGRGKLLLESRWEKVGGKR
jgi:hypothetical protein